MKRIVVPGELLFDERKRLGGNVFVSNGKIYAKVLGIADDEGERATVVPLVGKYVPQVEDTVIGVVKRVIFAGYGIDINSFGESFIPRSVMRTPLKLGDVISAKVSDVNEVREADLTFPKKLFEGEVVEIEPSRSPRLIGKNGSMLNILRDGTKSEIIVGKNGRIWAKGGDLNLLKKIIEYIEENSYKSNLTNAVQSYFEGK